VVVLVVGHDGGVDEAVGGGVDGVGGWSGWSGLGGRSGPGGRNRGGGVGGRKRGGGAGGRKRRRMEPIGGRLRRDSFAITARPLDSSAAGVTSMRTSSDPPSKPPFSNPSNEPPSPISPRESP